MNASCPFDLSKILSDCGLSHTCTSWFIVRITTSLGASRRSTRYVSWRRIPRKRKITLPAGEYLRPIRRSEQGSTGGPVRVTEGLSVANAKGMRL